MALTKYLNPVNHYLDDNMSYLIYIIEKEKREVIKELLKHDLISRQSITEKDAKALGFEKEDTYLMIEGNEENINIIKNIFKEKEIIEMKNNEDIYNKIKEEEENAAAGFGAIFG